MLQSRSENNPLVKKVAEGGSGKGDGSGCMATTIGNSGHEQHSETRKQQHEAIETPGEGQVSTRDKTGGRGTRVKMVEEAGEVNTVTVVAVVVVVHLAVILPLVLHYIPSGRYGVLCYYYNRTDGEKHELWPQAAEAGELPITASTHVTIIIHGFSESSHRPWIHRLTNALLGQEVEVERLVVVVDYWDLLSLVYPRMRENANQVASVVARIIDSLVIHNSLQLARTHLIGFSLGGRISGMVGDRISTGKLSRITGIDASYPWTSPKTRDQFLDAGDATLVVNIRTSPVGSHSPPSHIDFYANGGLSQPGCDDWYFPYLVQQVCNHYRSVALMIESVKHADDGVFPACGCPDWDSFKNRSCDCQTVNNFGLYLNASALGKFYFATNSEPPYSRPL